MPNKYRAPHMFSFIPKKKLTTKIKLKKRHTKNRNLWTMNISVHLSTILVLFVYSYVVFIFPILRFWCQTVPCPLQKPHQKKSEKVMQKKKTLKNFLAHKTMHNLIVHSSRVQTSWSSIYTSLLSVALLMMPGHLFIANKWTTRVSFLMRTQCRRHTKDA